MPDSVPPVTNVHVLPPLSLSLSRVSLTTPYVHRLPLALCTRFPHYISDFKDGLDGAVFSAAFFIFFAALAGAITFGGLMSEWTGRKQTVTSSLDGSPVDALVIENDSQNLD